MRRIETSPPVGTGSGPTEKVTFLVEVDYLGAFSPVAPPSTDRVNELAP